MVIKLGMADMFCVQHVKLEHFLRFRDNSRGLLSGVVRLLVRRWGRRSALRLFAVLEIVGWLLPVTLPELSHPSSPADRGST